MSGLEGLGIVANVIAVVDLSLKVISWCSKYAQDVKSSHDGRARLLQAAITLHYESEKVRELLAKKGTKLQASQRLAHAIGNSQVQLRELESQLSPKGNRSSLKWPLQKDKVEGAIQHIEKSTKTIIDILQIDMADLLVGIDDRTEAEEQRATIDQLSYVSDAVWDSHAEEHNDVCLPNTRTRLLQEVGDWVKDTTQQSKTVFWLNGMAGTGKSTISRTVSRHLSRGGLLGATFFFKRGEADRGGISKLIPTIARQLAMNQPALRPYIHAAIRDDPTIISKAVGIQFQTLIFEPLIRSSGESSSKSSIAIVIDALDECDSETDIRLILSLFSTTKTISHPRPRIFVTSRPDLPVRLGFQNVKGSYQDLILHDIPASIIKQDISTSFHHKMKLIREDWNHSVGDWRKLPEDWPGSEFIRLLTERAVPLFIFAATACRFISERQLGNPEKQLRRVLEYQAEGTAAQLDFTYRPVLAQLFSSNCSKTNERQVVLEFQLVVGTIINLLDPLSASALSRLLDVDQDIIDDKLDLLHSVLDVPSSQDSPVRMFHLSFRDYLMSPETRKHQFWVDEKKSARGLVKDCLRVMETLQSDICRLKIPGAPRSSLKPGFINACIPPEVQYACSYWVNHQVIAGAGPEDITTILLFLKRHLLHWIEVLSLLGKAFQITELIKTLRSVVAVDPTGDGTELIDFLNDATKLVDINIQTVDLAPLQIYCSVLVLAPSDSIVRQVFAYQIPAWVTLLRGQVDNWDSRLLILEYYTSGGYQDSSMVFSPDSKSLYSISVDGHIHVWSCDTGECIHYINLGQDPMTISGSRQDSGSASRFSSETVSPDGRLLAVELWLQTRDSSIVRILDLTTGQILCEISGHRLFSTLAFARDSKRLWSCTDDGQVCVWDVATGNCVDRLGSPPVGIDFYLHPWGAQMLLSLKGSDVLVAWRPGSAHVWYLNTNKVADSLSIQWPKKKHFPIQISPDGRLLVTPSSEDLSLVIWDLSGRKVLWNLPMGWNETSIALFSPESIFLIIADYDNTIRIWDMRNGKYFRVLTFVEHNLAFCSSITVSPDLRYLISAHDDEAVYLWNINTGTCVTLNMAYTHADQFSLFSPDGKTLAFKTLDCTIQLRDWERLLEEVPKATLAVEDFSFSSNSSMVATLFKNGDVTIWDAVTGALLHNFSVPNAHGITFSPDSLFIATTHSHESLKIWDLHTPSLEWVYNESGEFMKVYFSPDSQSIAIACSKLGCKIKIWVRENGTFKLKDTLLSSPQSRYVKVMFARDSKLVAASLDTPNEIKVWDCDTGHLVLSLPFEEGVSILALDVRPLTISSYSIIVSFDDHVEVWDLDACVCTLEKAVPRRAYGGRASSTGTFVASLSEQQIHIFDWSTGETLVECPFSGSFLREFDPESSIVRTGWGDFTMALKSGHHQQATQIFGVEPESEWIQWKGHNLFRLPPDFREVKMEVKAIPGDAMGFTVVIGSSSRGVVIMRFSNEGGMLDDIVY